MEQFLGLPPDGSEHGPAIDHLIGLIHWLMLILFVGWGIFYIYTLIRFRKSKNPNASYTGVKSHISSYAEIAVLLVEVVLLVIFSIPLWSKRVDAFPAQNQATTVRVVAEQFAWNIHYPGPDGVFGKTAINLIDSDNPLGLDRTDPNAKDDITTINQLNVPINKPVLVYLTTKDVIHSFSLPPFRVKQDAIPGMSIPVWFTPTKTTDQIREELRKPFSIAEAMKKVRKVSLPATQTMNIAKGSAHDNMMVMQDYADNSGSAILSKGEMLNEENVGKLADAGIGSVSVRGMAKLDNLYSMEDVKNSAGEVVVAKNEALMEDAVTKIIEAGMKEITARPASNMDLFVVMENYSDKSGAQIVAKGDAMGEDVISKMAEAGINEIIIAPATPTEIACAQLCGLGHYRMRGYMTAQTPEAFKQWFDEQQAALAPPPEEQTTPSDSTAISSTETGDHQH